MPIEPHEAPRAEWDYELETDVGATDPFIDANGLAYQLVSRMFVWFGYTPRRCAIRGRDGRPSRRDGVRAVALQIALSDASLSVAQRAHFLDGHSVRQAARPAAREPRTAATGASGENGEPRSPATSARTPEGESTAGRSAKSKRTALTM